MKLDDDIHNYYEQLVLEQIEELGLQQEKDINYLADLSCLALNNLPPKYIRYEVDMAFYLPNSERQKMRLNVAAAIQSAVRLIDKTEKLDNTDSE